MGASMAAQAVLRAVRQKEGDNNAVKYSDYDILCAINEVLRYLNVDLSNKQAECLRHIREYDEDQENDAIRAINEAHMGMVGYVPQGFEDYKKRGAKLPDDFVSLSLNVSLFKRLHQILDAQKRQKQQDMKSGFCYQTMICMQRENPSSWA